MNLTSGKFTAPRAGTYFFAFTGVVNFPASSSYLNLDVSLYLNGNFIGMGDADDASTTYQYESFSFQSTLSLKAKDQIWLQISYMSTGTFLYDDYNHHTHFSGWLLEEKIYDSLNVSLV